MARDTETAIRGQKINIDSPPDRSTKGEKADREAVHGRSFAGGHDDLSHSLSPSKYMKVAPKGGNR